MVFGNFGKIVGGVADSITDTKRDVTRMGRDMNTAYKGVQSLAGIPSNQRGAAAKTDPRTRSSAMYPDVRHSTAPTQNITDYTQQDEYPDYHVLDSQVVDASGKRFFQNSAVSGRSRPSLLFLQTGKPYRHTEYRPSPGLSRSRFARFREHWQRIQSHRYPSLSMFGNIS